jgi:hypothetical protein
MRSGFIGSQAGLAIIAVLFASSSWASSEDRINAAVALSPTVQFAEKALLAATNGSEREQVEAAIKAKLRVRAIECSAGYSPPALTASAVVREHLAYNTACFDRQDDNLARWIGLRRVGHLLRMPALRPIPTKLPASIVNSQFIDLNGIRFAPDAGVVLFRNSQTLETFDVGNGVRIARIAAEQPPVGDPELSPNARVVALFEMLDVTLLDVETGESLVHLKVARSPGFHWLNGSWALYAHPGRSEPTVMLDFDTGEERANEFEVDGLRNIRRIPGTSDEFLMLANFVFWKLRIPHNAAGPPLVVVGHRDHTQENLMTPTDGEFTSDGQWFVSAQQDLHLISIATLEMTTITMAPLQARRAIPLHDPDLLLLECMAPRPAADGVSRYIYSISRKTMAPLDMQGTAYPRFVYIPSVKQLALVGQDHLTPLDTLATRPAIPLEQVRADLAEQVQQYRAHVGEQSHAAPSNIIDTARTTQPLHSNGPPIHLGIGDSASSVRRALHTSQSPVPTDDSSEYASALRLRDRGIWVYFDKANRAQQYRFDAPFVGDIDGDKIGAWIGAVHYRLGRPARSIPGLSPSQSDIEVFRTVAGATIRYDFDKGGAVQTIRLLAGAVTITESNAATH